MTTNRPSELEVITVAAAGLRLLEEQARRHPEFARPALQRELARIAAASERWLFRLEREDGEAIEAAAGSS